MRFTRRLRIFNCCARRRKSPWAGFNFHWILGAWPKDGDLDKQCIEDLDGVLAASARRIGAVIAITERPARRNGILRSSEVLLG
jgi:hypothetical protein